MGSESVFQHPAAATSMDQLLLLLLFLLLLWFNCQTPKVNLFKVSWSRNLERTCRTTWAMKQVEPQLKQL